MIRPDFSNYSPLYTRGNKLVRELMLFLQGALRTPTQEDSDALFALLDADIAKMRAAAVRPAAPPAWAGNWNVAYTGRDIRISSKTGTYPDPTKMSVQFVGSVVEFSVDNYNEQGVWIVPLAEGPAEPTATFDFWTGDSGPRIRVTDLAITT